MLRKGLRMDNRENLVNDLMKVKNLIDTPDKWIRHKDHQINADGSHSYCIVGAILVTRIALGLSTDIVLALRDHVPSEFYDSLTAFNDSETTTHKDVMELFDKTIASIEDKQ